MFEFDSTEIYYPRIFITRIDTLEIINTIQLTKPFYQDTWFWTTIGSGIGLAIAIFK